MEVQAQVQSPRREDVLSELQRFEEEFGPVHAAKLHAVVLQVVEEGTRRLRTVRARADAVKDETCRVCCHPEVSAIDRALALARQSPRSVAKRYRRYGLSRANIEHHRRVCLTAKPGGEGSG